MINDKVRQNLKINCLERKLINMGMRCYGHFTKMNEDRIHEYKRKTSKRKIKIKMEKIGLGNMQEEGGSWEEAERRMSSEKMYGAQLIKHKNDFIKSNLECQGRNYLTLSAHFVYC
jgi:hypothetical protein